MAHRWEDIRESPQFGDPSQVHSLGQAYLKDVVFPIFAMDGLDGADIQATKELRAGIHPQFVPEENSRSGGQGCIADLCCGLYPQLAALSTPIYLYLAA